MKKSYTFIKTNLGKIYIEATKKSLVKLHWTKTKKISKKKISNLILIKTKKQILDYFKGKKIKFSIPLDPKGTKFQKKVWKNVQKINWGEKKSYGDISKKIFSKKNQMGARAIGNACLHNPILIVIPCHRIIYSNGNLGGYSNKTWKKKKLLLLEKSLIL